MKEKTKHKITIALIALTFIVPFAGLGIPSSSSSLAVYAYLTSALGYSGLVLLVWQFALGTRAVTGLIYKDVPRKIGLHTWLGKYGTLLILMHPIMAVLSYGESITYIFVPELSSEFARHVTLGRIAFIGLLLLYITSALVRGKLKYRPWKYIHFISYPVLGFSVLHIFGVQSSFDEPIIRALWSVCLISLVTIICLRLRLILGISKHTYSVVSNKPLTSESWVIKLKGKTSILRNVEPGQYVYVQKNLHSTEHPFSVVEINNENGEITLGYKKFGRFTESLAKSNPGDTYLIDGPYGNFVPSEDEKAVLIAGGIGITPLVNRALKSKNDLLIYGNKTPESVAFSDPLRKNMGSRLVEVFSEDFDRTKYPKAEYGYITSDLIRKYVDNPDAYNYYICGPSVMSSLVKKELLKLGVTKDRIISESFSF